MEANSFYIDHTVNVGFVDIENILKLQIFRKLLKERFVHKKLHKLYILKMQACSYARKMVSMVITHII